MRIVAALGGNALLRRGQPLTVQTQRDNLATAARALAALVGEHELVITHGNGPQVGLLALQAAAYATGSRAHTPLDVLGAESEGMVGYLIEQALVNALPGHRFATLLTQVEVDPADPAFAAPTKPIGPRYARAELDAMPSTPPGWVFAPDGDHWRRVVASPRPQRVLGLDVIDLLLSHGVTVICAGGGGIPVRQRDGVTVGVEAVIDKDHASGLLARQLRADLLLLLSDVPGVALRFGQPDATWLHEVTPALLHDLVLPAGSMGPKAQAALEFVLATGCRAAIGQLDDVTALVAGSSGTQVRR